MLWIGWAVLMRSRYVGAFRDALARGEAEPEDQRVRLEEPSVVASLLCKELGFTVVLMIPVMLFWLSGANGLPLRPRRQLALAAGLFGLGIGLLAITGGLDGLSHAIFASGKARAGHQRSLGLCTTNQTSTQTRQPQPDCGVLFIFH